MKDWQLPINVDERTVRIASIEPGVRKTLLVRNDEASDELALHREYHARWP